MKTKVRKHITLLAFGVLSLIGFAHNGWPTGNGTNKDFHGGMIRPTANGKLIAGGAFHQAGTVNAGGVTHSEASGSRFVDSTKNVVVAVRPLVYFRGQRYGFDSRVGGPQGVMMRQDSNLTWQVVPNSTYYHGTTSGNVFSTAVYEDELYVAGFLDSIGGIRVHHIAKWDGMTWRSVGTGIDNTQIFSMVEYANELYVGGNFQVAGGVPVHHLARWNGSTWRDVGGGMDAQVSKLEVYNNELYIRGNFDHAGGQRIPHLAKWNGTTFSIVAEDPNPPGE